MLSAPHGTTCVMCYSTLLHCVMNHPDVSFSLFLFPSFIDILSSLFRPLGFLTASLASVGSLLVLRAFVALIWGFLHLLLVNVVRRDKDRIYTSAFTTVTFTAFGEISQLLSLRSDPSQTSAEQAIEIHGGSSLTPTPFTKTMPFASHARASIRNILRLYQYLISLHAQESPYYSAHGNSGSVV